MSDNVTEVLDSEKYSRWVYCPRFIDSDNNWLDKFVSLRPHLNEEGISGQFINRCGTEEAIKCGKLFIRKDKNGIATEQLTGLCIALVSDIRKLSVTPDIVDVVDSPSSIVPAHAEIRFTIDGVLANGNTRSAKLKFYMDSIKRVLTDGYTLLTDLEESKQEKEGD